MSYLQIDSTANPRVKLWRALHRRRHRTEQGRYLVEGVREVGRAVAGNASITELLVDAAALATHRSLVAATEAAGASVIQLGESAMAAVSFRQNPAGIIAVATADTHPLNEIPLDGNPLILIADGIEKPGNLGAMVRTADAAGATAIVACEPSDWHNPNVIRSSQGAVFAARLTTAPASAVAAWADSHGISLVAASDGGDRSVWECDFRDPTAIVIGSEAAGLSAEWRGVPTASIPMAGISDSLNASVAAALFLYEAVRQRGNSDT